jgi:hypothetical protein
LLVCREKLDDDRPVIGEHFLEPVDVLDQVLGKGLALALVKALGDRREYHERSKMAMLPFQGVRIRTPHERHLPFDPLRRGYVVVGEPAGVQGPAGPC